MFEKKIEPFFIHQSSRRKYNGRQRFEQSSNGNKNDILTFDWELLYEQILLKILLFLAKTGNNDEKNHRKSSRAKWSRESSGQPKQNSTWRGSLQEPDL